MGDEEGMSSDGHVVPTAWTAIGQQVTEHTQDCRRGLVSRQMLAQSQPSPHRAGWEQPEGGAGSLVGLHPGAQPGAACSRRSLHVSGTNGHVHEMNKDPFIGAPRFKCLLRIPGNS